MEMPEPDINQEVNVDLESQEEEIIIAAPDRACHFLRCTIFQHIDPKLTLKDTTPNEFFQKIFIKSEAVKYYKTQLGRLSRIHQHLQDMTGEEMVWRKKALQAGLQGTWHEMVHRLGNASTHELWINAELGEAMVGGFNTSNIFPWRPLHIKTAALEHIMDKINLQMTMSDKETSNTVSRQLKESSDCSHEQNVTQVDPRPRQHGRQLPDQQSQSRYGIPAASNHSSVWDNRQMNLSGARQAKGFTSDVVGHNNITHPSNSYSNWRTQEQSTSRGQRRNDPSRASVYKAPATASWANTGQSRTQARQPIQESLPNAWHSSEKAENAAFGEASTFWG